ncbi:DUF6044 family protein [Vibrio genomosp. F10]|uniref:DUF6044 family protein n=1 Tax=Vibrio genomosp. F10 TaxID=723171 RepID=UPI0002D83B66|nr:DUF6044 family protein [Vibrio genomosp. F10]OEF04592.1 hypothetical protein A1QI_11030 [Vibrio genomosp. F10 str. 9ZB36]
MIHSFKNRFTCWLEISFVQALGLGVLSILGIYLLPRLILGGDSYLIGHDFLDSTLLDLIRVANYSLNPNDTGLIDQVMNGMPRYFLPSGANVTVWLLMVFEPYTAITIAELIVRLVGLMGMLLLLDEYVIKGRMWISLGVAICFALLPYYSVFGLSVSGQPILAWFFLNLVNKRKTILSLLLIASFPFYSSLALVGVFFISVLMMFIFGYVLLHKRLPYFFILGLVLLSISYIYVDYQLIAYALSENSIPSHRESFDLWYLSKPFSGSLDLAFSMFTEGQYHAASKHLPILIISIVALCLNARRQSPYKKSIGLLLGICALISLIYGFWHWNGIIFLKESFSILSSFNFSRFHFLTPTVWFAIFAMSLALLPKSKLFGFVIVACLGGQLAYQLGGVKNEIKINTKLAIYELLGRDVLHSSFNYNFEENLYEKVQEKIGRSQSDYRVVSIGFDPAVAQFNGFYTLDGYSPIYPLEYKNEFRRIISDELEAIPNLKEYYDKWGSRFYIFTRPPKNGKLYNLDLNFHELKKMGGDYIFSAYEIVDNPNVQLIELLISPISHRNFYLYSVE